jgi:hypothetical protein
MAFWERSNGGSVWTVGRPEVILGPHITSQLAPSLDKSSSKKVAANLLILQGGVEPLSSAPVWAEPTQLLIGMWQRA